MDAALKNSQGTWGVFWRKALRVRREDRAAWSIFVVGSREGVVLGQKLEAERAAKYGKIWEGNGQNCMDKGPVATENRHYRSNSWISSG